MAKYSIGLVKESKEQDAQKEEQEKLHKKYDVEDENKIIVEKTNFGKFLIKSLGYIVRLIADILIILLAVVGLMTIVYPQPRIDLIDIIMNYIVELREMLGIATIFVAF